MARLCGLHGLNILAALLLVIACTPSMLAPLHRNLNSVTNLLLFYLCNFPFHIFLTFLCSCNPFRPSLPPSGLPVWRLCAVFQSVLWCLLCAGSTDCHAVRCTVSRVCLVRLRQEAPEGWHQLQCLRRRPHCRSQTDAQLVGRVGPGEKTSVRDDFFLCGAGTTFVDFGKGRNDIQCMCMYVHACVCCTCMSVCVCVIYVCIYCRDWLLRACTYIFNSKRIWAWQW